MPVKLIANALLFQASLVCLLYWEVPSAWLLIPLAALVIHFTWIQFLGSRRQAGSSASCWQGLRWIPFYCRWAFFQLSWRATAGAAVAGAALGDTRYHAESLPGLECKTAVGWPGLLGAIAGPLSYFAGAALADVGLPLGMADQCHCAGSMLGDHLPIATRLRASVSRTIQATPAAAN